MKNLIIKITFFCTYFLVSQFSLANHCKYEGRNYIESPVKDYKIQSTISYSGAQLDEDKIFYAASGPWEPFFLKSNEKNNTCIQFTVLC